MNKDRLIKEIEGEINDNEFSTGSYGKPRKEEVMRKRMFWLLIAGFFTVVVMLGTSSNLYAEEGGSYCVDVGDFYMCCTGTGEDAICHGCSEEDGGEVAHCFRCDKNGCVPIPMSAVSDTPTPSLPPLIMQPDALRDFRPTRPTAPPAPPAIPPATPEATTPPTQIQPATPQAPTSGEPAGTGPAKPPKPPAVQPQPKAVQPGSPPPVVK